MKPRRDLMWVPRNGVPAGATEILRPAKVEEINGRYIYVLYIHIYI